MRSRRLGVVPSDDRDHPDVLNDAPQQIADLFIRMWSIDWTWYPKAVHAALIETLHTATLGTMLAIVIAYPVSLLAARNVTRSRLVNLLARAFLVITRSVHVMI
jgi:phosphonate transport system permease protein